jgi:hypothetical protein
MFENMTGAVGYAMHADRLATATRSLRIREAKRVEGGASTGMAGDAAPGVSRIDGTSSRDASDMDCARGCGAGSPHAGTVRARRRDPRAQWATGERGARQMLGRIADADRRGNRCRTASTTSTS